MLNGLKLIGLLLAVAAGVGVQTWYSSTRTVADVTLEDHCLLSTTPCQQQKVVLHIDRDQVSAMTPTKISVTWPNANSDQLVLKFRGLEMEMGEPMFVLTRQSGAQFVGEILLPTCKSGAMTWLGTMTDGTQNVYAALKTVQ